MILAILATSLLGLTELPPQKAEPGRCRVFLWTRTEQPLRIAMIDESTRTMRMRKGKQMFDIAEYAPGQYGGHGYTVLVNLDFADGNAIQNGQIIRSGSMRLEQQGGETMSVPVGGMRACS